MANGTIRKIVGDRGFGFIAPAQAAADGKDVFFHRADVQGAGFESLREGQTVTYEIGVDERRGTPKAMQVKGA
jgi:CspA family cold shock protein